MPGRRWRVLVVMALLLAAAALWLADQRRPAWTSTVVLRQVQQASELVTVKYTLQQVVGVREPRPLLGEESLLLVAQSRVLAGIDLSKVATDDIRLEPGNVVKLRLPPAQVFEAFVDEKETRVWDRRMSWWTPWEPPSRDLEQRARQQALEQARQKAIDLGLLKDARLQAERVISGLLRAGGAQRVEFHPPSS